MEAKISLLENKLKESRSEITYLKATAVQQDQRTKLFATKDEISTGFNTPLAELNIIKSELSRKLTPRSPPIVYNRSAQNNTTKTSIVNTVLNSNKANNYQLIHVKQVNLMNKSINLTNFETEHNDIVENSTLVKNTPDDNFVLVTHKKRKHSPKKQDNRHEKVIRLNKGKSQPIVGNSSKTPLTSVAKARVATFHISILQVRVQIMWSSIFRIQPMMWHVKNLIRKSQKSTLHLKFQNLHL